MTTPPSPQKDHSKLIELIGAFIASGIVFLVTSAIRVAGVYLLQLLIFNHFNIPPFDIINVVYIVLMFDFLWATKSYDKQIDSKFDNIDTKK
jgi:hypothetical protein